MCRPGVSRLHMFPVTTDVFSWPGRPPRQSMFLNLMQAGATLVLCVTEAPTGPYHWINPPPASASVDGQKQRKKIMCIAEDATHCLPGHHQRPVPSQPEGYIRQGPGTWGGG